VVRQDRKVVDEQDQLVLKDFDVDVEFAGRLRWYGKQGRLEIHYDDVENADTYTYQSITRSQP
jgi:transposase